MTAPRTIRIVRAPIGEAPQWVREAWVGLDLPFMTRRPFGRWLGFGVLSGPTTIMGALWAIVTGRTIRVTGYRVNAAEAVALLEGHSPEAARWWREKTPHLLGARQAFVFDSDACVDRPATDPG